MSSKFASLSWSSLGLAATLVVVACSAADPSRGLPHGNGGSGNANPGTGGSTTPAGSGGVPGSGGTVSIDVPGGGSTSGGTAGMESCATQEADAMIVRQPVDVIVVIDNSGSM